MTPRDILAALIDDQSWEAADEVARWQIDHGEIASPLTVLKLAAINHGSPEVVLALTLGMIKRAHLGNDGRISSHAHDYVCVHDDSTILNRRNPALCAALAIWMHSNPSGHRGSRNPLLPDEPASR